MWFCKPVRRSLRSRCRKTTDRHAAALIALVLLGPFPSAADEVPRTTNDAVYTAEQAATGERLYRQHCLQCHDRRYFRPVLARWEGQPLALLYSVMSASMPESNPGALPRKDYVDILAYILSLSRYPSGAEPLDFRGGALDAIVITSRKAATSD